MCEYDDNDEGLDELYICSVAYRLDLDFIGSFIGKMGLIDRDRVRWRLRATYILPFPSLNSLCPPLKWEMIGFFNKRTLSRIGFGSQNGSMTSSFFLIPSFHFILHKVIIFSFSFSFMIRLNYIPTLRPYQDLGLGLIV